MIAGSAFLELIEQSFPGQSARHFRFPFVVLEVWSQEFEGRETDEREQLLAEKCRLSEKEVSAHCDRLFLRFYLRTPEEPKWSGDDLGRFWLRSLAEPSTDATSIRAAAIRAIHFYGYKGGQARSSVLSFLASVLATSGWRVLVVDADAEAPSLDVIFRATVDAPEATAVGLRAGLEPQPQRVFVGRANGAVDLLAFRPSDSRFDLDAAALAMEQSLSPSNLATLAQSVVKAATAAEYDVVFVDHRTGLAPTVLPWVEQLPGPIAVFARLDEQWRPARGHLRALWRLGPEDPGVIVSFKNDTDTFSRYRERVRSQVETLLDDLAGVAALRSEVPEDEQPTGEDFADHWVVWPFDGAFVEGALPAMKAVGGPTLQAVSDLRRLLDLGGRPKNGATILHRSGARDEGDLIQTTALRTLTGPNNLLFVLGRKGTGKTRLMRALAESDTGEPLLVADDFLAPQGIRANWAELKDLAAKYSSQPIRLWWLIFTAALEVGSVERDPLLSKVRELADEPLGKLISRCRKTPVGKRPRLFLLDGLETAFEQSSILVYIAALVQFISTVDGDDEFRERGRLQVFVRTDLAIKGYENFEQLSQGRTLTLEWDAQAILNFVLSRVASLDWFRTNFESSVTRIVAQHQEIRAGAVEIEKAEEFLLEIFPERLKRLNLLSAHREADFILISNAAQSGQASSNRASA